MLPLSYRAVRYLSMKVDPTAAVDYTMGVIRETYDKFRGGEATPVDFVETLAAVMAFFEKEVQMAPLEKEESEPQGEKDE